MDLIVVYESNTESYMSLIKALTKESFNPVALERPDSDALYVPRGCYMRGVKIYVYIAVPKDEKRGAVSFLRKWDQLHQSNVGEITKNLGKQFCFAVLIFVSVVFIFILFDQWNILVLLLIFCLLLLALKANAEKFKQKFTKRDKNS